MGQQGDAACEWTGGLPQVHLSDVSRVCSQVSISPGLLRTTSNPGVQSHWLGLNVRFKKIKKKRIKKEKSEMKLEEF